MLSNKIIKINIEHVLRVVSSELVPYYAYGLKTVNFLFYILTCLKYKFVNYYTNNGAIPVKSFTFSHLVSLFSLCDKIIIFDS